MTVESVEREREREREGGGRGAGNEKHYCDQYILRQYEVRKRTHDATLTIYEVLV